MNTPLLDGIKKTSGFTSEALGNAASVPLAPVTWPASILGLLAPKMTEEEMIRQNKHGISNYIPFLTQYRLARRMKNKLS